MTAQELSRIIDRDNCYRDVNGRHCLTSKEIRDLAIEYDLVSIADKIDVNGSPWSAEMIVKGEIE